MLPQRVGRDYDQARMTAAGPSLAPAPDEVAVFTFALPLARVFALPDPRLDAAENARARGFRFEVDRARYVASHLALRGVLGACLGVDAAAVRFDPAVPALGKPRLLGAGLRFNLSHAGAHALIAVATREVGVDIEEEAAIDKTPLLPLLSPAEAAAVRAEAPAGQVAALRRLWPRKEAYVKALGLGLSGVLADFDVSTGEEARLEATRPRGEDAAGWMLTALAAPPGYQAALVYQAPRARVLLRELPWSRFA